LNVSTAEVVVSGTKRGLVQTQVRARRGVADFQAVLEAVDMGVKSYNETLDLIEVEVNEWRKTSTKKPPAQGLALFLTSFLPTNQAQVIEFTRKSSQRK